MRAPHPLLAYLIGKEGEVKEMAQTESHGIFKVNVRAYGLLWFAEDQLEALPEEKVPEAEGGPQDPREVGS